MRSGRRSMNVCRWCSPVLAWSMKVRSPIYLHKWISSVALISSVGTDNTSDGQVTTPCTLCKRSLFVLSGDEMVLFRTQRSE